MSAVGEGGKVDEDHWDSNVGVEFATFCLNKPSYSDMFFVLVVARGSLVHVCMA
jgi:hypothetical protein